MEEIYKKQLISEMEKQHLLLSEKKVASKGAIKSTEIKAEDTEKSSTEASKISDEEQKKSMNSSANSNNSTLFCCNLKQKIKEVRLPKLKIFTNKANSRFKFSEETVEDKDTVIVQDHISQILNKKLAKFCFYKSHTPSCSELDHEIYIEKHKNSEWMIDIKYFLDKKKSSFHD